MGSIKTPLRYPGGKQRLWPFIHEILETNDLSDANYVEPYAGGAGVGIELLLRKLVSKIHLNDSCPAVHAFWHSILNETEAFCRKISRASLTVEEWKRQREVFRNRHDADRFDLGFAMFFLNRCNRSGILGAGVIGGMDQTGNWKIDARFSRNDLINRIEAIAAEKSSIRLRNWDAERFLLKYVSRLPMETLVYCDPPYFNKADRLYPNHYTPADHSRIAKVIQGQVKVPWVVSYDACGEIVKNYSKRPMIRYDIRYSAGKASKGTELFIFSDKTQIPAESSLPAIQQALSVA
ncbi:MAG: DNA adenine methylase [Verrucomicrobiota bacterium]